MRPAAAGGMAAAWLASLAAGCAAPCVGTAGPGRDDSGLDAASGADAGLDAGTDAAAPSGDGATDATPPGSDAGPAGDIDSGGGGGGCPAGPLDCSPGPGTGSPCECVSATSCYIMDVQSAVTSVIAAHPEWFDYANPAMCPFILNIDGFMDGVVADLLGQGLCAIRDPNAPNEEVTVKHDNSFAESFDIVASNGCARYGPLIYTATCTPAWW